ncbi:hypothetical protein OCK74_20085 [Chitinophagaceae bacterium LB-8]|uniref:Uncharacterized protein n=1 Tax=Paraflavisolibacter caeni TaxID=2982496 RepID=A0A9X2Y1D4_9BACT|nr:hypothetical protein [Paraflavisolibacter caeni]MCU7551433.1 hypothetical protein [Paraflavisolibacter caeni]
MYRPSNGWCGPDRLTKLAIIKEAKAEGITTTIRKYGMLIELLMFDYQYNL